MGFAITYSALFAKVWRVHKIYKLASRMRRKTVDYKDVFFIIIIVVTAELIVLIAWQLVSPQVWQRDVIQDINGFSIESIGMCSSENSLQFSCSLVTLNVIFLFVALVLCWRTKDIPSDFSESNYIFLSVMFMFQILLLGVPITAMVRDDANVYFFIRVGSIFLQNLSVLLLIFLPKMRRIYIGEDTDSAIRCAIATDAYKEGRSSYIRARASFYHTESQNTIIGAIDGSHKSNLRSQDSQVLSPEPYYKCARQSNLASEDSDRESESAHDFSLENSLEQSDKRTVESISKLDCCMTDESSNQTEESKDSVSEKAKETKTDQKFVDNTLQNDEASGKDRPKIEKQLRSVTWGKEER